tara:strand:+ start:181 stop:543 length:363 start_codon:yes stop_codon:yes gene_type:complete
MKITNEDLRKIILEEIEAVLSEDEHPAIANSTDGFIEDEVEDGQPPKPVPASDLKRKLVDASKAMNDPKVAQKMKGRDSGYLGAAIEDALATALKDGDNTPQAREDAIKRQQTKKRFQNK